MKHNPADPALARPRPLRPLGRPRVDAALREPAPLGLRRSRSTRSSSSASSARRRRATPRTSRRRASRRRPARSARASRNGVGMAMAEKFLREKFGAEVCDHHIFAHLLRRRPDGGRRLRGGVARRPPAARPARLPLRRQRDHDRRPDRASRSRTEDVADALRGVRLAHAHGRRRQRPRGDRGGDPRRDGRGASGRR